jgi:hypothetical protein
MGFIEFQRLENDILKIHSMIHIKLGYNCPLMANTFD